jgi:hypothetical protein
MEMPNTFGLVAAQIFTHANVESIKIASILLLSATAARLRHYN